MKLVILYMFLSNLGVITSESPCLLSSKLSNLSLEKQKRVDNEWKNCQKSLEILFELNILNREAFQKTPITFSIGKLNNEVNTLANMSKDVLFSSDRVKTTTKTKVKNNVKEKLQAGENMTLADKESICDCVDKIIEIIIKKSTESQESIYVAQELATDGIIIGFPWLNPIDKREISTPLHESCITAYKEDVKIIGINKFASMSIARK